MRIPERIPDNVSIENVRKLIREFNAMRDVVRSLTPLPSNTESLDHTALGIRRGNGRSTGDTTTTNQDAVWG